MLKHRRKSAAWQGRGASVLPAWPLSLYVRSIQGGALRTLFEVLKEIVHDTVLTWKISRPSAPRMASGSLTATGPTATHVMEAWVGLEKGSRVMTFSTAERE